MSLLSRLAVQAARAYGILSSNKNAVSVSYLVVAGGGGGANNGGGGAGGLLTSTATLSTLNTYTITVGAGGAGNSASNASPGQNSVISGTGLTTITATGGGYGGGGNSANNPGGSGGSGGGGSGGSTSTSSGTAGQGNAGGKGDNASGRFPGGGGGGAGAAGTNGSGGAGGNGGNGSASSISGSSVTYAGGGGGGGDTQGTGGTGGGGAGVASGTANSGTANLGGGGGANNSASNGGSGGSGIVIISYASATPRFVGGTLTTSGGNQIHTFTSSGTLSPLTPVTASYLVVAGGGGGNSGGGGAGGLLTSSTTIYSGATYIVTVGAGGVGGVGNVQPTNGSNSVLSGTGITTVTSTGGGYGGQQSINSTSGNGGSGGGGGRNSTTFGTGTSGQGFNGGAGATGGTFPAGGGGGAGAVGGTGSGSVSGAGGLGVASSISGTSTYYAGGGGGSLENGSTGGAGGLGGGGAGSATTGTAGTANTGGGGGGGVNLGPNASGAAGGSGTVIISYAGSQVFNGGLVTSSGGNTIHTFNATGALTPLTNNLTNSLRFRSSASAYLSRTPTVAGNTQKWTLSQWTKRGTLGVNQVVETSRLDGSNFTRVEFLSGDTLQIWSVVSSVAVIQLVSTQVFRDPSAWYHIVVAVDTTQATAANRVKLYINGNQVTAFSTATYPSQNASSGFWNQVQLHEIAAYSASSFYDGYLTDIYNIDGQALEPYYFGNNDANGVWKPIKYTGTYGTNGFYLTFGNTTSTTTIGYDTSGNNNNFTSSGISLTAGVTYDAMTDVPTNTSATVANYAVLNPLITGNVVTPTNANLTSSVSAGTNAYFSSAGTIAVSSGKWYWECSITARDAAAGQWFQFGIVSSTTTYSNNAIGYSGNMSNAYAYFNDGGKAGNGTGTAGYGATFTTSDIIGIAFDADAGTITFYKNNVSQGQAFSGISSSLSWLPIIQIYGSTGSTNATVINFGQRPLSYTPPSGFVALNTFNLPTPTILQGNKYMDATLYTGTGVTQVVVNQGQFKPDLVWIKGRSGATSNGLEDSVRGSAGGLLVSNTTAAESPGGAYTSSLNSNGFTVNSNSSGNGSGSTYVGWQWQAGQSSGSSNTSGSITSTVSVNATAGFSVVTYTGTGANATVGHGLGVAPKMLIVKNRSVVSSWRIWFTGFAGTELINLNETGGKETGQPATWNSTVPTSTVFSLGTAAAINGNGNSLVAYLWAEIAGFSAFGSYTGNGSADGPFVFTGFRPKWIMIKRTDSTSNWVMFDTSRSTYNLQQADLYANLSDAEATNAIIPDILSNGFKVRTSNATWNTNGGTWIYAAFAENPFKNANAR
jgi:hypothetical protein